MKSKTKWIAKIMVFILIVILLSSNVLGLGIAPSRKVLNYEPGEHTITSRIINDEGRSLKMLIYPKGSYSNIVNVDESILEISADESEKSFTYTLDVPEDMRPGPNTLEVVAMELPADEQFVVVDGEVVSVGRQQASISSVISLIQQVIINVPYPGIFAEGKLYINPGGVEEETTFSISVFNRGTEPIEASGYVVIKGPTNEEIARVHTNSETIAAEGVSKLVANWKANVNPGKYHAEAVVTYNGKSFELAQNFEVGDLFIEIEGIRVKNFRLGSIAKFDIDLLNKWNQPISNVVGELQIMDDKGSILSTLETNSVNIAAKAEETISGYWDTEGVGIGNYDVNVMLEYEGKTTQKLFETVVSADGINFKDTASIGQVIGSEQDGDRYTLLIILVLILIIINIALFVYFKKKGNSPPSKPAPPVNRAPPRDLLRPEPRAPTQLTNEQNSQDYTNKRFEP